MKLPDAVDYVQAATATDAGQTAYGAVIGAGKLRAGERVGIIGLGGLGLTGARIAVLAGAQVYAADSKRDTWGPAQERGVLETVEDVRELAAPSRGPVDDSFNPNRSCSQTSGLGAHQFTRPIRWINAGTSTVLIMVASTRMASVRPTPNIRMNDTWAAANAANEIDMTSAAAVMTRPVRARPSATLSSLAAGVRSDASQYSRMRDTRNTS
jgi:Zn-dependent alcohol dehydrogenase